MFEKMRQICVLQRCTCILYIHVQLYLALLHGLTINGLKRNLKWSVHGVIEA